jgi:type I restriction enzyme, S subunit
VKRLSSSAKLGEISAFITKGATPTTYGFDWERSGIPFLRSECVSANGLDMRQSMFISAAAHVALDRSQVRDGDILMTITGNVGRVIRLWGIGEANINQHIARIRIEDPRFDSGYVYHYLSQRKLREHYEAIVTGLAYPQISLEQVRDTKISAPSIEEQRKIASSLDDADQHIAALERLIAKKQKVKDGVVAALLTGRTRLPGFAQAWREVRLKDAGSTYTGLTGKTKMDFGTGSASFITFMEVMSNPRLRGEELGRVRVGPAERQNQVRRGDLLLNGSSETPEEVALAAVVDFDPGKDTFLNSFCFGYRLMRGAPIDPVYLAYFFRSGSGRSMVASLAQGATRYNIAKTKLVDLSPMLPPVDEQRAIAATIKDCEDEIDALKRRVAKARGVKIGMMQALLPGPTRLSVARGAAG